MLKLIMIGVLAIALIFLFVIYACCCASSQCSREEEAQHRKEMK